MCYCFLLVLLLALTAWKLEVLLTFSFKRLKKTVSWFAIRYVFFKSKFTSDCHN